MTLAGAVVAAQFAAVTAETHETRQRQGSGRMRADHSHQSQVQSTDDGD
jgi:hypothetical protein